MESESASLYNVVFFNKLEIPPKKIWKHTQHQKKYDGAALRHIKRRFSIELLPTKSEWY